MGQSYVQKVSRKGQVSIPVEIRKKYNIDRNVAFIDDGEKVMILPTPTMEKSFGIDGDTMKEVAKEITRTRKREISLEGR
nr:AbrB/MazE/SpoVT family DNA-binding domain-containing protein [Candidatus Njordarchaeota archaeon]